MIFGIECFGLSQRRACKLIGLSRNTLRYKFLKESDEPFRKRMRDLAEERRRFGCRRLHVLLKREGLVINHKRTERIYREEGLSLRIRKRRKMASVARVELPGADKPDHQWSMDFVSDSLSSGRRLRILSVIDNFSRECLAAEVDTSIGGKRVVRVLNRIACIRDLPESIVVDNGPEFIGNALDEWAYQRGIRLHFIRPGKPVENAYIESFNGKLRDECLNQNWFLNLEHAREVIEEWRMDYNQERPHSSLGDLSPEEFVRKKEQKMIPKILEFSSF